MSQLQIPIIDRVPLKAAHRSIVRTFHRQIAQILFESRTDSRVKAVQTDNRNLHPAQTTCVFAVPDWPSRLIRRVAVLSFYRNSSGA